MLRAVVIGAGEVFMDRYLDALGSPSLQGRISVEHVIDVKSPDIIEQQIESKGHSGIQVHQINRDSPFAQARHIIEHTSDSDVFIIATPTQEHVPLAVELLKSGKFVAIEKPYASDNAQIVQLDRYLSDQGEQSLFLFGYYLLEKGLAARVFAAPGGAPSSYFAKLNTEATLGELTVLRNLLGQVKKVDAVLLEGKGNPGKLQQRPWVLQDQSGGNTVETFYHLMCMLRVYLGTNEKLCIKEASLGVHSPTASTFKREFRTSCAETLTTAKLKSTNGVSARLVCAKYVPESLHQRWLRVEFENGTLHTDLESCETRIEFGERELHISLTNNRKYVTQFKLLADKFEDPNLPIDFSIFRNALVDTLEVRNVGKKAKLTHYDTTDLSSEWLDQLMSG